MTSKESLPSGAMADTLYSLIRDYLENGEWWSAIGVVHDKKTIDQIIQEAHGFGIKLPKEALNFLKVSVNARDRDFYFAGLILQLVGLRNSQVRERHISKKQEGNPRFVEEDIFLRWSDLMSMGTFDPEMLLGSDVIK